MDKIKKTSDISKLLPSISLEELHANDQELLERDAEFFNNLMKEAEERSGLTQKSNEKDDVVFFRQLADSPF